MAHVAGITKALINVGKERKLHQFNIINKELVNSKGYFFFFNF